MPREFRERKTNREEQAKRSRPRDQHYALEFIHYRSDDNKPPLTSEADYPREYARCTSCASTNGNSFFASTVTPD